jgi:hypothetical protein
VWDDPGPTDGHEVNLVPQHPGHHGQRDRSLPVLTGPSGSAESARISRFIGYGTTVPSNDGAEDWTGSRRFHRSVCFAPHRHPTDPIYGIRRIPSDGRADRHL